MGAPFSDITLYTQTTSSVGTPEYIEQVSLQNFVSDLYVQNMNGYKPPKTSRITIQPAFHNIWNRTWKTGSIIAIAPYFSLDTYVSLDNKGKLKYILDLIQGATLALSEEYGWDKSVFENAYNKILESDFKFKISFPTKKSRDKNKSANIVVKKTYTVTSIYVKINTGESVITKKMFDKNNQWWYDCIYILARHNKWFDKGRYGISYLKGKIDIWYSLDKDEVELFENGNKVTKIDFGKYFILN